MNRVDKVLDKYWRRLKRYKGVLNVQRGTKFTEGRNTKIPCIVVYVEEKKPKSKLLTSQIIPDVIEGVKTDVVELKTEDYKLGETSVSNLHPKIQRKIAGGVKKNG